MLNCCLISLSIAPVGKTGGLGRTGRLEMERNAVISTLEKHLTSVGVTQTWMGCFLAPGSQSGGGTDHSESRLDDAVVSGR